MRMIDADALINALITDCNNDQTKMLPVWIEKQIDAQPTVPYDMKWNPECEDCLPEGIDDCIECHQRMEGRDM